MRAALLIATGCLIAFCQPGFASTGYIKLSRPGTAYDAFMVDRNACLEVASYRRYDGRSPPSAFLKTTYNFYAFSQCMRERGYRLDPNGYRAAWYSTPDGRRIVLRPNPI